MRLKVHLLVFQGYLHRSVHHQLVARVEAGVWIHAEKHDKFEVVKQLLQKLISETTEW